MKCKLRIHFTSPILAVKCISSQLCHKTYFDICGKLFLAQYKLDIIVFQIDGYRFNRGSLINAGFKFVLANATDCDYIGMHDVDLLPLNDNISYAYPGDNAFHVASPNLHPRYHYQTFIGGILLINR